MKARIVGVFLLLVVLLVSVAGSAELVRLTVGVSAAYLLWQTSPPIYGTSTYWGGIGIELLYRSISISAALTLADLKTLRISDNPAASVGASITVLRLGDVGLSVRTGLMLQPLLGTKTVAWSASTGVSWSPLSYMTMSASLGYETVLYNAQHRRGDCISVGVGVSMAIPVL